MAKVLSIQPDVAIVTRGRTASAVASAAYISRSRLTNERDGITHDYSRSHPHERLVADLGIELPRDAPERLRERAELWNEVERSEARSDSQLARKIMIPLPDDLTDGQAVELAREIIAERVA
ncbi:MAG: MobA/MobL family protein, partial [Coriobacteriales bacterium]